MTNKYDLNIGKVQTLFTCDSIVELINEFLDSSDVVLEEGAREKLLGVDDWEATKWMVVNGEIVICYDSISGDVIVTETLDELFEHTNEYLRSEDC